MTFESQKPAAQIRGCCEEQCPDIKQSPSHRTQSFLGCYQSASSPAALWLCKCRVPLLAPAVIRKNNGITCNPNSCATMSLHISWSSTCSHCYRWEMSPGANQLSNSHGNWGERKKANHRKVCAAVLVISISSIAANFFL